MAGIKFNTKHELELTFQLLQLFYENFILYFTRFSFKRYGLEQFFICFFSKKSKFFHFFSLNEKRLIVATVFPSILNHEVLVFPVLRGWGIRWERLGRSEEFGLK